MCCYNNTLGKGGRALPLHPSLLPRLRQRRDCPPRHPDEGLAPSTRLPCRARMTAPPDIAASEEAPHGEAPPAARTPAIIELPYLPPPAPAAPTKTAGRHFGPRPVA